MSPPLSPDVALYLLERYPGLKRVGLSSMWVAAWYWIEERVPAHLMYPANMPPVFEAIAILRVQHICATRDPIAQQAFAFASHELIAPFILG